MRLLLLTSAITTFSLMALPLQAATNSFSKIFLDVNNFNIIPDVTDNTLTGDNIALSKIGSVDADFDGALDFVVDTSNTYIDGYFETIAEGEGEKYFGLSQVESEAIASFSVEANQLFSFDFATTFNLNNSLTDAAETETIETFANLSLLLVDDNNNILDFFELEGNLTTNLEENNDYLIPEFSNNVSLTNRDRQTSFGRFQEEIEANFIGSFERLFTEETNFTLIASSENQSVVANAYAIPSPSSAIASILSCLGLGILLKIKSKS